uniref:Uncharacterized protein n=1 Tax=Glossina austeni TaxID=7395 RepID=A0A1A9UDP2_GLOAU
MIGIASSGNFYRSSLPETRSPIKRKKKVSCKSRYGKMTNLNDQLEQLEKLDPNKPFKDQETLFIQKLRQCCVLYDFDNPDADVEGKQLKYMILRDIMDYLIQIRDTLSAAIHQEIIGMVSCNLFYSLPSVELTEDERKEDGLVEDVAWPHLTLVYQVFHIFLYHSGFVPINAQYLINKRYLTQLFHLLSSEDKRERVAVRKILVAIYNQFSDVQQFIRKEICYIFLSFIYEGRYCNGIPQLLQMM